MVPVGQGMVPVGQGMVPASQGGMGVQHGVQAAGGDMGMSAGAKRQREEAEEAQERRKRQMEREAMPRQDKMDLHILRIYRTCAMRSQDKVQKERKKGDVALDPRREPDPNVLAMIRQACEIRLRQVCSFFRTRAHKYVRICALTHAQTHSAEDTRTHPLEHLSA
jgi:hypothetical protein